MTSSLDLNVDQFFFLALEFKKSNLIGAKRLMQQALSVSNDKNGPINRNLLKIQNEISDFIKRNDSNKEESPNDILVFAPHLLPTQISSHKFLYLAWIKRIQESYPGKKVSFILTHEGGHSSNEFNKRFFEDNMSEKELDLFDLIALPRFLVDEYDFAYYLSELIGFKPFFSLYFETVETIKYYHVIKYIKNFGPVLSVHCSPRLPMSDDVDLTFVGQEARAYKHNGAHFLPIVINEKKDFDPNFKVNKKNWSNKLIVTAFTNNRIVKALNNNRFLRDNLIEFLQNNDVEWHFIGHEKISDFFNLDKRFLELEDKIHFPGITKNLAEYYSQSDVYAYLPGFHGGDSGTRIAVESGIPCLAMKESDEGYIKYATEPHVASDINDYFSKLDALCKDDGCAKKVASDQFLYLESLKSVDNLYKFQRYVEIAVTSFQNRVMSKETM